MPRSWIVKSCLSRSCVSAVSCSILSATHWVTSSSRRWRGRGLMRWWSTSHITATWWQSPFTLRPSSWWDMERLREVLWSGGSTPHISVCLSEVLCEPVPDSSSILKPDWSRVWSWRGWADTGGSLASPAGTMMSLRSHSGLFVWCLYIPLSLRL